jgi:anti-sigma regulatory factor (Ser/Thr protein kinase)
MSRLLLDLAMEAGVGSPKEARTAVLECGLPLARNSEDLALMVSEVVTNAVRHGTGPGGELLLRVEIRGDVVHVELEEPGVKGWTAGKSSLGSKGVRGSSEQVGGWGLQLVNDLSDKWGVYQDPHRSVWFDLQLIPESTERVQESG